MTYIEIFAILLFFFIVRYSAKTLECLASLPVEGLPEICYDVIASLIQHIILHKPVSKLLVAFVGQLQLYQCLLAHSLFQLIVIIIYPG